MLRPFQVLLVEDNPADIDLTRDSLDSSKLHIELSVTMDGVAAIDFLAQRGAYADAPRPDLIVLDLNLPLKDGRDVLAHIKAQEVLRRIPVVVLTSSAAETDVLRSYELGANCYITKPLDFRSFHTIVQSLEYFWFTIVKLPPTVDGE